MVVPVHHPFIFQVLVREGVSGVFQRKQGQRMLLPVFQVCPFLNPISVV